MRTHDVIVVGLGTVGSATCRELARRGRSVLGLDAFRPPHDRGSHHGESRSIRRAYLEGTAYVPMALRARRNRASCSSFVTIVPPLRPARHAASPVGSDATAIETVVRRQVERRVAQVHKTQDDHTPDTF